MRSSVLLFSSLLPIALVGCAAPQASVSAPRPAPQPVAPLDQAAIPPLIARDPPAYLRLVAENCSRLEQYTVLFIRQERRGLPPFRALQPPEEIQCWFRRSPFSVRMKWLDPDIKYGESTYVEGQERNKVRFVPRHGLFGLPPGLVRVSVSMPVTWGEARYSVFDFGLERLAQQTIDTLARFPSAIVSYQGIDAAPSSARPAHKLRIDYPLEQNPAPTQELYFDIQTDLPLATIMRFPDGSIDTAYTFDRLDTSIVLSDADFLLDAEKGASKNSEPQVSAP